MNKMVKVYVDSATVERLKCGRPGEGTVRNTLAGVRTFGRWLNERRAAKGFAPFAGAKCEVLSAECDIEGYDPDSPMVSIVTPKLIHAYLADLLKKGVKPVTAMSYLNQFQSLFAKWVRPYYEDRGWKVPPFPSLGGRPKSPHYRRPSPEQLAKVKAWYEKLSAECGVLSAEKSARCEVLSAENFALRTSHSALSTRSLWFVATMMLEFGMRNSDVMRLKRENFIEKDGAIYLNYTPHKTENSSGRIVRWPVHEKLWEQIRQHDFSYDDETFDELNRQMRGLGFTGAKGAYELRKICVDHIYQRYGAEMATSISGDDIKTIIRYYADPSQPNIGAVRVIDLL